MPTRSNGCFLCRKRKIRCDEQRPGCGRCATHGVPCPGYRQPAPGEVIFRDETREVVLRLGKGKGMEGGGVRRGAWGPLGAGVANNGGSHAFTRGVCVPSGRTRDLGVLDVKRGAVGKDHDPWRLDESMFAYAFTMPQFMRSPAAEKDMMFGTFIDAYLPKPKGYTDAHNSFLKHLFATPNLRPEVSQALEALAMVQIGSIYNDRDMLKQSVKAYCTSLDGLMRILGRSEAGFIHDDYVLATVTVLASCEFFDEISQKGEGWARHLAGSQQLLAARGPDSVQSKLALMLYTNMRHGALSHALLQRKGTFMGQPAWRAVAFRSPVVNVSTLFYDIALQVPTALERFDRLDRSSAGYGEALDQVYAEMRELEADLREWFNALRLESMPNELYHLVSVDEFPTFRGLVKNRYIAQAYRLPNFLISWLMSTYWDVMHFLRTTIKNVHLVKHDLDQEWYPEADEAVKEEELLGYVMNMCRCFPQFCEPSSASVGQIGIFLPLRTTALYSVEHGHWALLKWVGEVRDNVFIKGMRPPTVRERRPNSSPSEAKPVTWSDIVRA